MRLLVGTSFTWGTGEVDSCTCGRCPSRPRSRGRLSGAAAVVFALPLFRWKRGFLASRESPAKSLLSGHLCFQVSNFLVGQSKCSRLLGKAPWNISITLGMATHQTMAPSSPPNTPQDTKTIEPETVPPLPGMNRLDFTFKPMEARKAEIFQFSLQGRCQFCQGSTRTLRTLYFVWPFARQKVRRGRGRGRQSERQQERATTKCPQQFPSPQADLHLPWNFS